MTRNNFRRLWRILQPVLLFVGVVAALVILVLLPQVSSTIRYLPGGQR